MDKFQLSKVFQLSKLATKADIEEIKRRQEEIERGQEKILSQMEASPPPPQEVNNNNPLPNLPIKNWYNTEEVAQARNVSFKTVERWCRQERLLEVEKTPSRTWKISRESLVYLDQEGLLPEQDAYHYQR